MKTVYRLQEILEHCEVDEEFVVTCIRRHWVIPFNMAETLFDEADLARILLVHDLLEIFEVNDVGISIILRLIDQLHLTRSELKKLAG